MSSGPIQLPSEPREPREPPFEPVREPVREPSEPRRPRFPAWAPWAILAAGIALSLLLTRHGLFFLFLPFIFPFGLRGLRKPKARPPRRYPRGPW